MPAVWYFTSTNFTVFFWRDDLSLNSAFSYVWCFLFYLLDYDFALKSRYYCASIGFLGWHGEFIVYFYNDFFKCFSLSFWILSNFCIAFWKEMLAFSSSLYFSFYFFVSPNFYNWECCWEKDQYFDPSTFKFCESFFWSIWGITNAFLESLLPLFVRIMCLFVKWESFLLWFV